MLEHLSLVVLFVHLHESTHRVLYLSKEHHCGDDIRLERSFLIERLDITVKY